jgi:hypothetical protein
MDFVEPCISEVIMLKYFNESSISGKNNQRKDSIFFIQ